MPQDKKELDFFAKISQNQQLFSTVERIPTKVFRTPTDASKIVATCVANVIREKQSMDENCLLGLDTGSHSFNVYKELIRMHKEEDLSFKNCHAFMSHEYYPLEKDSMYSTYSIINNKFQKKIDIQEENCHFLSGTVEPQQIRSSCDKFEKTIKNLGGIDVQILSLGKFGAQGFNEPGSKFMSISRKVTISPATRSEIVSHMDQEANAFAHALTIGLNTIMNAKRIFLCAFSEDNGDIVYNTIEGPQTEQIPATVLHDHKNTLCILDAPAAEKLTRFACPWIINGANGSFEAEYDEFMTKKAVAWLSEKTNKFIMSQEENDYRAHGLLDLLLQNKCSVAELNFRIWSNYQNKITAWPVGGAPPNWESLPFELHKTCDPKKVMIFSPHPDDDVICMGATMEKLNKQGHEVFVAYQTSGAFAVMYDNVVKNLKFTTELSELLGLEDTERLQNYSKQIIDHMSSKKPGEGDHADVQTIKALSRQVEAHQAAIKTGVKTENIFNINQPFYKTGAVVKKDVGEEDMQIHKDLLNELKPDHIFCAGDLTDPHGTHRKCLEGLIMAINVLKQENCEWLKKCEIWFYRGAWQEWEIERVDLAVTLTQDEIYRKRMSVFQHDTQKDPAPFYGMDPREFWQRIEQRNSDTGTKYTKLGIVNCPALEVFVNYRSIVNEISF